MVNVFVIFKPAGAEGYCAMSGIPAVARNSLPSNGIGRCQLGGPNRIDWKRFDGLNRQHGQPMGVVGCVVCSSTEPEKLIGDQHE